MGHRPLSDDLSWGIDGIYTTMSRAVRSLDDAVGFLLSSLGDRASNTLVVYLSDNGYLYGEHARWEKGVPYEESVRVPMIVRYPPSGLGARVTNALVENVDIAPTIARLAGIAWTADGFSLLPTLQGATTRTSVLIDSCLGSLRWCPGKGSVAGQRNPPGFSGVITQRWAYIRYGTGEQELYDLWADPFEMRNLAARPEYERSRRHLAGELDRLDSLPAHRV
jgi:arylsulfatase A-like enzyme